MSFRFKWAKVRLIVYISFAHKLNRARWLMFTDTITSCFASLSPSVFFFSQEFLYHHTPIQKKTLNFVWNRRESARSIFYLYLLHSCYRAYVESIRLYTYNSISTIHAQISHAAVSFTDKKWFFPIHSKHLAISFHSFSLILV